MIKINNKNQVSTTEEVYENRARYFLILLYEDTSSYNFKDVMFDLKGNFKYYAYIKHIPEKDEKKEHIHFFLAVDNARTISSLSKRIGVPAQFIQRVKGIRASCRYLTHRDNDDKIQYDLTDVKVSPAFSRQFYGAYDDLKTEQDVIEDIYNYIDVISETNNIQECIKQLILFVNNSYYDRIYKRYRTEFMDYLRSKIVSSHI